MGYRDNWTIEQRIARLETRLDKWTHHISQLNANMTHYKNNRLKQVIEKGEMEVRKMKDDALERYGKKAVMTKHNERVMFLCSANQARKLRRLLDADWRSIGLKINGDSDVQGEVPEVS
jgi:hypothetical protein